MNFYFIYSAGGGAGDWNGVKRMWSHYMPSRLKSMLLLKFGDVFLEHASGRNFIRPERWREIDDLRMWLYQNVNDDYVFTEDCDILLDSGTAKAVNNIAHHNPNVTCNELIRIFNRIFVDNHVFEKYVDIVYESGINSAVTFDIPNPFKIRSQNGNARLNIIDRDANAQMVNLAVDYANKMYSLFIHKGGAEYADHTLSTIINGLWSEEELSIFLDGLSYNPKKLAIGGLSSLTEREFYSCVDTLMRYDIYDYNRIHFLGCGGFKKVKILKDFGFNGDDISVDCSTFINRSIDGSTNGKAQSGYFDYKTRKLIRIKPETKSLILDCHLNAEDAVYSMDEMEEIIDSILWHQSGHSSIETYNARAKLIFHNADVFRHYANL